MDPRTLVPVVRPAIAVGFATILLAILHAYAVRHDGSITKNLGAREWVVAFLVVGAAGLFSNVVLNVMVTPYSVPVDWTLTLIRGPINGALGAGLFVLSWRLLAGNLPARPNPVAQKG